MSALYSSIQVSDQAAPWEVLTFCPSLRAFFRNKAPEDEIDDLIQEVLIRMHGRDAGGIDNLEHYVIRVARNVLRDRYRRDQVRRRQDHCELLEHDHPPDDMSPERILRAREQLATTLQAMDELPERSRTILVLLRWEGMSYSEVAELLSAPRRCGLERPVAGAPAPDFPLPFALSSLDSGCAQGFAYPGRPSPPLRRS